MGKSTVITWRGMMTKLMLAVYEAEGASRGRADGWEMNAMVVDVCSCLRLSRWGDTHNWMDVGHAVPRGSKITSQDRTEGSFRVVLQASIVLRILLRSLLHHPSLSYFNTNLLTAKYERSVVLHRQDQLGRIQNHLGWRS